MSESPVDSTDSGPSMTARRSDATVALRAGFAGAQNAAGTGPEDGPPGVKLIVNSSSGAWPSLRISAAPSPRSMIANPWWTARLEQLPAATEMMVAAPSTTITTVIPQRGTSPVVPPGLTVTRAHSIPVGPLVRSSKGSLVVALVNTLPSEPGPVGNQTTGRSPAWAAGTSS